ncbi:MAG TPA: TonB family protein [Edaphobacter sp.]|jgi:TonB family protein|nr:TonB family protein [Edaphobacter sp.]
MRKVIVATLALTPMLLHAQANSPAQTQSSPAPTTLQSKLVQPKELNASEAVAHSTTPIRVSTGVAAPKLIHTVAIESDSDWIPRGFTSFDRKTVVEMTVDATGKPSNLKILQSLGPQMDHNVLAAVSQYRFTPGTLDGQPTTIPVNLEVVLRTPRQ